SQSNGYFQSIMTPADVTISLNGDGPTSAGFISGEFDGYFTRQDPGTIPGIYDVFVGGFNFRGPEPGTGEPLKFLSGMFVLEREDRASAYQLRHIDQARRALVLDTESKASAL